MSFALVIQRLLRLVALGTLVYLGVSTGNLLYYALAGLWVIASYRWERQQWQRIRDLRKSIVILNEQVERDENAVGGPVVADAGGDV